MAPANSKTNFKSFDVQARLLRAIVAAHPEVKWNYKEIRNCYGSDLTDNIMGHRMRHIRTQAAIIRKGLDAGFDPKDMPVADQCFPKDQNKIDPDICKYFGESTTDGIQFQFRSIKRDAQSLKAAADNGDDPATALSFTAGTPSSKRSPTKSTPGTGRSMATVKSTGGRKRKADVKLESEDDASEEVDYKARDPTPTPAPRPAKRAKTTAVDLTSESDDSAATPARSSMTSLLVDESKPASMQSQSQTQSSQSFYEDSFAPSFGMGDAMMNPDAMESFYPIGEI